MPTQKFYFDLKKNVYAWLCFINKLPCDLQLIGAAFEHNALDLVFFYMDLKKNADVRLAFEAIKVELEICALNIMF